MLFDDRTQAGKLLAEQLIQYKDQEPVILALPRGGVPVAVEVAEVLHAPLDVIICRKIGATHDPEFGIGAISEGKVQILDEPTIKLLKISKEELDEIILRESEELKRRIKIYRNDKPFVSVKNKTVIVVDDGLATGVTARAAVAAIKKQKPKKIVLAFPVCPHNVDWEFKGLADDVVCIAKPINLSSIGCWYHDFKQVDDKKVIKCLKESRKVFREQE